MCDDLETPSGMESVLLAINGERPEVRAMFRYALVLLMIDDERARVIGTRLDDSAEIIGVRTITGDVFEVVRPNISQETERMLLEQVREIASKNLTTPRDSHMSSEC